MRTGRPIRPIVIAHRGASGYLPEHTLPAKALAYAMGADYLEQDLVASKDDELIVVHDAVLDRTTDVATRFPGRERGDGRFYARDFTLAEIRSLAVHERVDAEGNAVYPHRYPVDGDTFRLHTFAEEIEFIERLIDAQGRPVGIYPEIKHPAQHRESGVDITRLVVDTLHDHGFDERDDPVYLQCFDAATVHRIRHELRCNLKLVQLVAAPQASYGGSDYAAMLTEDGMQRLSATVDGIGPRVEELYKIDDNSGAIVSSGVVEHAHDHGLAVHPYTLRRDALPAGFGQFDELLGFLIDELRVDGVFTDFPDLVRWRGSATPSNKLDKK